MARHSERELAFQVLYSLHFSPADSLEALAQRFRAAAGVRAEGAEPREPEGFAWQLVQGVWDRLEEIDGIIAEVSRRPMERLGRTELVILRMGTFELLYAALDSAVVLSEAVILANDFGDEPARQFINGTLFGVAQKLQGRPGLQGGARA